MGVVGVIGCVMVGCSVKKVDDVGADITGSYALVSVNGKKLPAKVKRGKAELEIRSGGFTFKVDGACSAKTVFIAPNGKEIVREVEATYKRDGGKMTMKWKGAGTTTGSFKGETFTMNNKGMLFAYRK